jgi:hypothetical protein
MDAASVALEDERTGGEIRKPDARRRLADFAAGLAETQVIA